jgi:hypothetical protein
VQPDDAALEAIAEELTRPGYRSAAGGAAPWSAGSGRGRGGRGAGGGAAAAAAASWQEAPDPFEERRGSNSLASTSGGGGSDDSGGGGGGVYSYSRLQLASPRDLGAVAYALDFFKFNHPGFWAAAAEAALPELPGLAPNVLANLLTGVAHSCVAAARAEMAPGFGGYGGGASEFDPLEDPRDPGSSSGGDGERSRQPASLRRGAGALVTAPLVAAPAVAELFSATAALLAEEPRRLRHFRPRDLASLLAAYATAGQRAPAVFSEVTRQLLLDESGRRLGALRARDAALLAWASVHALCADRQLLAALASVLRRRAGQLAPHHAALVLWAYATAGVAHAAMLRAVCGAAAGRVHAVHAPVAASVAWALGRLGFEAPALMEDALDRLAECMEEGAAWWGGDLERQQDGSSSGGLRESAAAAAAENVAASGGRRPSSVLEQLLLNPALSEGIPAEGDDGPMTVRLGPGASDGGEAAGASDPPPRSQSWALAAAGAGGSSAPPMLPEDAAHAMWACGRLRHWNGAFLAALRRRLPQMLGPGRLRDVQVVAVLWACARLNYANQSVLSSLCDEVGVACCMAWAGNLCYFVHAIGAPADPQPNAPPPTDRSWRASPPPSPPAPWPSPHGRRPPSATTTRSCWPRSARARSRCQTRSASGRLTPSTSRGAWRSCRPPTRPTCF